MKDELKARFDREIKEHPVVLYMKGNALFPRCGFSASALTALKRHGEVFTVDVLTDPEVREGIKEYSSWPTIPQIYIRGKFIGGSDIVCELEERGELGRMIQGG
jgi:monothiol glutaredoxin